MRCIAAAVAAVVALSSVSCDDSGTPRGAGPSARATAPGVTPSPPGTEPATPAPPSGDARRARPRPPGPDAPLPGRSGALARRVDARTRALYAAVDEWVERGRPRRRRVPRALELNALYVQRAYRVLARDERLAQRVLPRLHGVAAADARAAVPAIRGLLSLARPVNPRAFRVGPPTPAGALLRHYRAAQRRFGVRWELLAAVNFVESRFNRMRSASYAGALGPMQFLPSTWDAYGMGGDVHDPRDAIMGAANYLAASGAPDDVRGALYAYNPSEIYVDAVLRYARRIERRDDAFYALYAWQVFVTTARGDVRLTGPGLRRPLTD
ncbi:MAG TPA: lytic transglycosylase domain-containing protein [Actinomycetota bacterium]|nr:lytic transglycosylase domain-containing protein [Actinomycetota bacterium]